MKREKNYQSVKKVNKSNQMKTIYVVQIGLLTALSVALYILMPGIPIFPTTPFLLYDLVDIPVLVGSVLLGPIPGFIVLVLVSAIQAFQMSAGMFIGFFMHVMASGVMMLAFTTCYRKFSRKKGLILGSICGTIAMTLVMIIMNFILTPLFMGAPISVVVKLLPYIIGFNLIKAGANTAISSVVLLALLGYIKKMVNR